MIKMCRDLMLIFSITSICAATFAYAGKVDDIQAACKKKKVDLASEEALRAVKDIFLSCTPGQEVKIVAANGECSIPCLKSDSGSIVGK